MNEQGRKEMLQRVYDEYANKYLESYTTALLNQYLGSMLAVEKIAEMEGLTLNNTRLTV